MATSSEFIVSFEADKDLLLSRVNQLVFEDGEAGIECGRCDRILIRHYIADCGHKYCANCRKVLTVSKSNCPLPDCGKPMENIDLQDVEFERELYDLRAHCPNKNYGCPFGSQLKDLGSHLRVCKDTRDNALPVLIPDNNLVEAILRELSSKFDRLSADVSRMREETREEVDKRLREMQTQVENRMINLKTKLDNNLIEIKEEFECNHKITQLEKSIKENQSPINNLDMVNPSSIPQQMNMLTLAENKGTFQPDFTWKISGIKDKVKKVTYEVTSEVFEWRGHPGVKAQAKMNMSIASKVRMSLILLVQEHNDREETIDSKLIPQVYYVLRDQTQTNNPQHVCRTNDHYFATKFDLLDFMLLMSHKSLLTNLKYNARS